MAWTKEQRKAHSVRMKQMWERKSIRRAYITADQVDDLTEAHLSDVAVNHPLHYTNHPSGIECIQVTEHMNFCRGNAIKYIWRAGEKGSEVEDLRKAVWYINREIERISNAKV